MEVVVEGNSSRSINKRTVRVMDEILGDHGIIGVSKDSLHGSFGGLLEGSLDLLASAWLFGAEGQINHGDIRGGDTDGHTGEFSVEGRDDLTHGLGGSSGGWDQVVHGTTSSSPVLSSLGGSIDDHLGSGGGVDGGHETLHDSEFVVQDLGEWGQAVGGTRGVGKNGGSSIFSVVDTHDIHGGIRGRSGNDDTLASSLQVGFRLGDGGENTCGFADSVSSSFSPFDFFGVAFVEELDGLSADDQAALSEGDLACVNTVDGVVLELVGSILRGEKRIVDSDNSGL